MTRDEAIAKVRDALVQLQFGAVRASACRAFDRLVYNLEASDEVTRLTHDALVAALPEVRPALDRILAERALTPRQR